MGRKRIALTPAEEADFTARVRAGHTVRQLAAAFGGKLSATTIKARRLEALAGPAPRPAVAAAQAKIVETYAATFEALAESDAPDVEIGEADAPPSPGDEAVADLWLQRADRMFAAAQAAGKPAEAAAWGRLVATFLEHRRKARPVLPPPTEERPDMVEMRERARERLHALVDKALEGKL